MKKRKLVTTQGNERVSEILKLMYALIGKYEYIKRSNCKFFLKLAFFLKVHLFLATPLEHTLSLRKYFWQHASPF